MLNLKDLAIKYKPVLYLNSNEKYYPCDIEKYLENCELFYKNIKVLNLGEVNENTLVRNTLRDGKPVENVKYWNLRTKYKNKKESSAPLSIIDAPIYSKSKIIIYDNIIYYEITYIFFYAYNGPYHILGMKFDKHYSDIEHITIRIDKNGNLTSIYFGRHGYRWGEWKDYDEIEKNGDGRPIIYIAKSEHGNYHNSGTHYRIFFLANDKTNRGIKWDPQKVIDINEKSYSKYRGWWGYKIVPGLPNQKWWYNENEISAKWYEILFFPCLLES